MKYARKTLRKFLLEQKLKTEKMPFSGAMCARGIASSTFQISAVYCHFHGDASTSITCRKSIGADSFWSAGNVFGGLKHKILPVDRLIANLSGLRAGARPPRTISGHLPIPR
jgi:hypothetical protein